MRIRLIAGAGAVVALLGLTSCKSSPDVAFYVGDKTVSEARVTQLIDDYVAAAEQAGQSGPAPDRAQVVNLLVGGEVCERLRARLGFQVPPSQMQGEAPELSKLGEQAGACIQAIPVDQPAQPSEAEIREVFDAGVRVGRFQEGTFEQQRQPILADGVLADAVARRKAIMDEFDDAGVTVNPRYRSMEFALLSWQEGPAFSIRFGGDSPVVTAPRQPSEAPVEQPQQ